MEKALRDQISAELIAKGFNIASRISLLVDADAFAFNGRFVSDNNQVVEVDGTFAVEQFGKAPIYPVKSLDVNGAAMTLDVNEAAMKEVTMNAKKVNTDG